MKQLLVMFFLLCSATVFAQDVIVKKDGSTIVCRVVELTSSEIVYKKWSDLNGSNYVMNRTDALAINYQDGKKVNLSETGTNLYAPGNQNDGVQQYNDKALLAMDVKSLKYNPAKRAKNLRMIGWIGGGILAAGAAACFIAAPYGSHSQERRWNSAGGGLAGTLVVWMPTFLILAHKYQKQANLLQNVSLYEKEFKLYNGSTLSAGIDMLSDKTVGCKTFGFGLRYNF